MDFLSRIDILQNECGAGPNNFRNHARNIRSTAAAGGLRIDPLGHQ